MNNLKWRGALAGTLGAAVMSVGLAAAVAPAAFAQAGPISDITSGPDYGLTINKFEAPYSGDPADGTPQTLSDTNAPMQNVEFSIRRVYYDSALTKPVDLTTNQGWVDASAVVKHTLTPAEVTAGSFAVSGTTYYMGPITEVATGASGAAPFNGLYAGLYVGYESVESTDSIIVHRTAANSGDKTVTGSQVSPVKPFFATTPMTNPNTLDAWMSNVKVYPKNSVDAIAKQVFDKGALTTSDARTGVAGVSGVTLESGATRQLTYQMLSTIPSLPATEIGNYVVLDKLDARAIGVPAAALGNATVRVGLGAAGATLVTPSSVFVDGADYKLYVNDVVAAAISPIAAGAKIEVVMTQSGLNKMAAAFAANSQTQVVVQVSANAVTEGNGVIPNDAQLMPSDAWWTSNMKTTTPYNPATNDPTQAPSPITSNKVFSLFGDALVTKTDAAQANKFLNGAVFDLYMDATPGDGVCQASGTAVIKGLTSDSNGQILVKGLQVSNFNDGALVDVAADGVAYCLVETKAPVGYNLLAEPIYFEVTASGAPGSYTVAQTAVAAKNVKSNLGNAFPLTGGQGAAVLAGGSIILLAAAGGYLVYRRRQDAELATAAVSNDEE